jgi:hypothetical protein
MFAMACVEIKRPGSEVWESGEQLGGRVPLADVVGSLVRYPTGDAYLVTKVVGLDDDGNGGKRLRMEMYVPGEEVDAHV